MKKFRAIIYLLLFLAGIVFLVIFLSNFINSKLDQSQTSASPATNVEQPVTVETTTTPSTPAISAPATSALPTTENPAAPATSITTISLVTSSSSFYNVTGTVKSKNVVSLFPQLSGSIKKVNFQEGDYVNIGETVVELTGNNLTEHPSETQLKIAQTNLANAKVALSNLKKSNTESLKTANLQLQSAVDQANAIAYDLAAIQQNQTGLQDGIQILQDSLNNTQEKNNRDLIKGQTDIQTLIYTLNSAQNDRAQTMQKINDLQNQIDNLPSFTNATSPASPAASTPAAPPVDPSIALEQQLAKLQTALDAQTKGIDTLYDTIDKSKYGLSTAENTSQLSTNQILGQIETSQNQNKVLDLNLNSTKTKLGYTGASSDALQLAQQAYNSTKVLLNTTLDTAENQVKLAQLNYDLAQNSASGLIVKAPFSGLISSLDLSPGQQVNPQTAIAEIINPQSYELEVNIDPAIADRINLNQYAEVELSGHTLEVPIKSIAPVVNGTTRLVKVRLTLPPISFKANQTLNAQLPLHTTQIQTDENGNTSTTFLPLDAVIIGTESQFVYVNDHGKAKKVQVKLGQISGDQVEILSGLSTTDQVILQGAKDLSDGQSVQVK